MTDDSIRDEQFLTVEDVADKLKVHRQTVRRWLRDGELRGYQFGDRTGYRIKESDLVEFIERHAEGKIAA